MTAALPELWLPSERAYTRQPPTADEQAFTDLHGDQRRYIPGDHGRAPGRPTYWQKRRIHNVPVKGGLL